jgi:hypothetical protein
VWGDESGWFAYFKIKITVRQTKQILHSPLGAKADVRHTSNIKESARIHTTPLLPDNKIFAPLANAIILTFSCEAVHWLTSYKLKWYTVPGFHLWGLLARAEIHSRQNVLVDCFQFFLAPRIPFPSRGEIWIGRRGRTK